MSSHASRHTLNLRGRLVTLECPWVMGILNITPDSFYSHSRAATVDEALAGVERMLASGADIIDIGACSTRPGSATATAEEEEARLIPALAAVRERFPEAIVSIDTFRAAVAGAALEGPGADIINDVSGGADPEMMKVVARNKAVYIIMHSRGTPATMDSLCDYSDLMAEIVGDLAFKVDRATQEGIADVIVDPGFGFAKTAAQNMELLHRLDCLKVLGCPVLAALSRKRFTRSALGEAAPEDALVPTVALNAVALMKGADIIRVHDVAEGVQTAKTIGMLWNLE